MKHIVITGSTRGIGRGLAEQFLLRGYKVTLNGTSKESLNNVLPLLEARYQGKVQGFIGRIENKQDMENLYEQAVKGFGEVDIWINNAGIDQERLCFIDYDLQKAEKVIKVNIMGT